MSQDYTTLCGITEEELQSNFKPLIESLARQLGQTEVQLCEEIKRWYNGYYFHHSAPSVYNPYSVLSLFRHREFNNYWFETGTPTFLLDLLQEKNTILKISPNAKSVQVLLPLQSLKTSTSLRCFSDWLPNHQRV